MIAEGLCYAVTTIHRTKMKDKYVATDAVYTRVEVRPGHAGHSDLLGHILSWSSRSNLFYKISKFDPYSALDHMH